MKKTLKLLGLGGALALSSCQDDAQLRVLNDQIRALEAAQGHAKAEMNRVQMQMRSLQTERDKIKEERDKLEAQIDEARKALDSIQKDFDDYRAQYKLSIRKRAPGMELEVVEVDGKRFENVRIRELTEDSMIFMHGAGTMSVNLSQLKPEMQRRLGYEVLKSVMAAAKTGAGDDLEAQARRVDEKLNKLLKERELMQKEFYTANLAIQVEERKTEGNPTVHRGAAAAMQVKLNEMDVELKSLQAQQRDLGYRLRASRLR